ncbi:MAG TPA: glycosyltransferase family 4 protein, partial [Verrucomicrobiae bacterium]|nr:glycosyltransferase family 4 protein [Verrucomicrobiae bacterium]
EQVAQMRSRSLTFRLLQRADLSIVLSQYNRADAEKIFSKNITVVGNGIPDPCPDFEHAVLPRRHARFAVRKNLLAGRDPEPEDIKAAGENPRTLRILYIAHCTRAKGVFDAIAGVTLANRRLREQRSPLSMRLIIAGTFVSAAEKAEFELLQKSPEINDTVEYLGFVSGDQKDRALRDADLFCFPTYYENENQPVNLIEAMAYGLPILTTRWRSLPELFPADYAGLVDIRSPQQIADAIPGLMTSEAGDGFRQIFLGQYTLEKYLAGLAGALKKLDAAPAAAIKGEPVKAA